MQGPFVHRLRVRYGECDPQGIVFNANYLMYFDVVFTELWRAAIGPWQEMVQRGIDAVVADASISFRAPARFDDELELRARVTRIGETSITTNIDVTREQDALVTGTLRHVCVSTPAGSGNSELTTTPWPSDIRRGLQRFGSE